MATAYCIGLDLGQAGDFTALAVVQHTPVSALGQPARYACRHLQRWPIGTPYPAIADALKQLATTAGTRGDLPLVGARLVVDATGVGKAAVDLFRNVPELAGRISRVMITAGLSATFDAPSGAHHVPKKELVSVLQVLMQTGRLKVAASLPHAPILIKELLTFRAKIPTGGEEAIEAWRERDHDDLVLALAVALWYAERYPRPLVAAWPTVVTPGRDPSWW